MQLHMMFDDPKTFTKVFSIAMDVNLVPDTELLEFVCNENERDAQHLVGKLTDERKSDSKVAPATLSRYVGTYQIKGPRPRDIEITLSDGGALMMSENGKSATELLATSQTSFYDPDMGGEIEFFADAQGKVTHLILAIVEADMKAERK